MTNEQLIAELRVADLGTLQSLKAVLEEEISARLSPDGARAEAGAIETDAQVDLDRKFGRA